MTSYGSNVGHGLARRKGRIVTKRLMTLMLALAFLALSTPAVVVAQEAATPAATPETAASAVDMPSVEYIDETGNTIAVFTVTSVERGWSDHSEWYAPQSGNEYVRIAVSVDSQIGRGTFTVEPFSFLLQDVDGFISQANVVPTEEEEASGAYDPFSEMFDLAGGESGEIVLTFEVLDGVDLQALYFSTDLWIRLVTLAEFDE
jgi:hypothetical protein